MKFFLPCRQQMFRQQVWPLLTVCLIYQVKSPKMCESHRGLKSKFQCKSAILYSLHDGKPCYRQPYCSVTDLHCYTYSKRAWMIWELYWTLPDPHSIPISNTSVPRWYGNWMDLCHIHSIPIVRGQRSYVVLVCACAVSPPYQILWGIHGFLLNTQQSHSIKQQSYN